MPKRKQQHSELGNPVMGNARVGACMQAGAASKLMRCDKAAIGARFARRCHARGMRTVAWLPAETLVALAGWLDPTCVLAFASTCREVWHCLFQAGRVQQARAFASMIARLRRGNTTLSLLQQSISIPYPVRDGAVLPATCGTMWCQLPASVVLAAVSSSAFPTLQFAPEESRACRRTVLAAVQRHGLDLQHACAGLRADWRVVLAAVQSDGLALQFASKDLRASNIVVRAAVHSNGSALQYASDALRGNKALLLSTTHFASALQAAAPELLQDADIAARAAIACRLSVLRRRLPAEAWDALHAKDAERGAIGMRKLVAARGSLLQFASPDLRRDRECVASAVHQNGLALAYAHSHFRDDFEIVVVAAQSNSAALAFASDRLRNNRILAAEALASDANALTYLSASIQADAALVLGAARWAGNVLSVVGESARRNEAIVLAAVANAGLALAHAPLFHDNATVVLAAVGQCGLAVQYASKALRGCRAVVYKAVTTDGLALRYAEPFLRDDHGIVLAAVRSSPSALRFASLGQRNRLDVVRAAVSQPKWGWTLRYAIGPGSRPPDCSLC